MSSNRLAIARVFDLLERAHGVGGRGSERPGWMEQRLLALLERIAKSRAQDPLHIAEGLEAEPKLLAEIAWKNVYGRSISADEREKTLNFIHSRTGESSTTSDRPLKTAIEELCLALFNTNEFIYMP